MMALELAQAIRGTEATVVRRTEAVFVSITEAVFVRRTEAAVVRRTEAAVAIEASSPQLKEPPHNQLVSAAIPSLVHGSSPGDEGESSTHYSLQSSHLTISSPLDFTGIACATPELSSHVDGIRPFKRESATRASSYWPDSPGE